ncbi:hypothetical protein YC2023_054064 [Brassica napus]
MIIQLIHLEKKERNMPSKCETGRVLRGSLITTRVQICAGSEAAVEDIDFSEFEDCSRVSVSFVCFVFSRSLSHGLSLFLGLDIHFIWSVLYPMVVVKSVSGELRGLDSRRWSLDFLTVAVALSLVLRNCLEFPFQGLGCPLSCLWRSCVQGSRLFLTRRRSFYWFSIGEYVRGCGGLRFGLSESSCLCGVVLETVKFPVVEVSSQPVSWQLISLISDGSVSLYFSLEAVVILCCGGTDVVVASYIFGEAAMTLRCGGSDVVVPSYFSSKVAAFLRRVGTDVVVVSYFPAKAAVILRCVGSDVVVASYFSSEAAAFVVVAGLMCEASYFSSEAATYVCHGWIDVVGVFYLLSRGEGFSFAYRSKASYWLCL